MAPFRLVATLTLTALMALASHDVAQAQDRGSGGGSGGASALFFGQPRGSTGGSASSGWGVPRPNRSGLRSDLGRSGRSTVPINVNTLANGTANQPIVKERPKSTRHRTRRPRFRSLLPTTVVRVNQVTVVESDGSSGRRKAVRNIDALRRMQEEEEAEATRSPSPEAEGAPPEQDDAEADRPGPQRWTPLVRPSGSGDDPESGSPDGSMDDESRESELDPAECVSVWITTEGGIEWRRQVAVGDVGADDPNGAARLLQRRLRRGEPLALETTDGGGFTVPAHLVETLVVGPCR